jgi:hypothetical protein
VLIVGTEIYGLAGLRIVSDFRLRGLQGYTDKIAPEGEILIRRARIPEGLALATATLRNGDLSGTYNGREVLLEFPTAGRFLVRSGNEILVDPAPSSDDGDVRSYLLGTAFGVLCHQRGITPLHASAINVTDGFVAFVGDSGAGKSTLAAALARRGHQVVADDVCFLRVDSNGDIRAWPGVARIRLWEAAMQILGCDGPGIEQEILGYNKYFIPVVQPRNLNQPRRLRRVYVLNDTLSATNSVTRLQGSATLEVLLQNVYRMGLAEYLGYKPNAFKVCTKAACQVSVFRFSRPKDFDALEETVEFLENHLHDTGRDHCTSKQS